MNNSLPISGHITWYNFKLDKQISCHSVSMISCTCSSPDGVKGGQYDLMWVTFKESTCFFLKWKYHSNVLDQPSQESLKAYCSIIKISEPVFTRKSHKSVHKHC